MVDGEDAVQAVLDMGGSQLGEVEEDQRDESDTQAQFEAALADDNECLPENKKRPSDAQLRVDATDPLKAKPFWLPDQGREPPQICPRAARGGVSIIEARLKNYTGPTTGNQPTRSGLCWHFTPLLYWYKIVTWTNENHEIGLTLGELKLWWTLRRLMSCYPGHTVAEWFTSKPPGMLAAAPYSLRRFMSQRRFKKITRCISFSRSQSQGGSANYFREEIPAEKAWNDHMDACYEPGGSVTPDESMMKWLHRLTCPGWMCCPRKPWCFGRERHTVADSNRVIFRYETQMGRARPIGYKKKFEDIYGKGVVALVLRLCEPVFQTGRTVHLDSGFCVLLLIAALRKVGLFGQAQIKKRRYGFVRGADCSWIYFALTLYLI